MQDAWCDARGGTCRDSSSRTPDGNGGRPERRAIGCIISLLEYKENSSTVTKGQLILTIVVRMGAENMTYLLRQPYAP